jgi:hypothetical protein
LIKLLPIVMFVLLLSFCAPLSVYATSQDDGWTEGDYQGSQEEQEQQAQDDWEDAGRPGDNDDDDNDDDNGRDCENPPNAASCNNGTDANGVQSSSAKPYCDKVDWKVECHDRYDFYEGRSK